MRDIISNRQAVGKQVSMVCSSCIKCTVYDPGVASIVHSYYGLEIADLSCDHLVERLTKNSVVIERVRKCDVLIWDEASMSSQCMLELVHAIHHHLSDTRCNRPFGGKQLILVGEFLQLRPVPNDLDEGLFMYHAPIFQTAISHRYELTDALQQNNPEFLTALKDVRVGKCSENTLEYLRSFSRPVEKPEDEISYIYFKRLPVALHNRLALQNFPLPEFTFEAEHMNETRGMNWPGSSVLHLRPGCPVILVWNLNEELTNGSQGVFEFLGVVPTAIEKQTWFKRDKQGNVAGSICQFPIVLSITVICHKAQGLTLSAAIVHCSSKFVPGLTYIASSRVKDPKNLQVLTSDQTICCPRVHEFYVNVQLTSVT